MIITICLRIFKNIIYEIVLHFHFILLFYLLLKSYIFFEVTMEFFRINLIIAVIN